MSVFTVHSGLPARSNPNVIPAVLPDSPGPCAGHLAKALHPLCLEGPGTLPPNWNKHTDHLSTCSFLFTTERIILCLFFDLSTFVFFSGIAFCIEECSMEKCGVIKEPSYPPSAATSRLSFSKMFLVNWNLIMGRQMAESRVCCWHLRVLFTPWGFFFAIVFFPLSLIPCFLFNINKTKSLGEVCSIQSAPVRREST